VVVVAAVVAAAAVAAAEVAAVAATAEVPIGDDDFPDRSNP